MYKGRSVIAVMPLYDQGRDSYWMLPGYMKGLEEQGAIVLMPSLCTEEPELDYFLEACDGFVLTGGQDVAPSVYGEEVSGQCGDTRLPGTGWMPAFCGEPWNGISRCWESAEGIS